MMITDFLYFREQQQLFLFDWNYIAETVSQPGGLAILTSRFLVQFFHSGTAAVIIAIILVLSIAAAIYGTIRNTSRCRSLFGIPLSCVTAILLLMSISDVSLHFDSFTALLIAAATGYIHSAIGFKSKVAMTATAILETVITWFLAGPASLIFALTALITDLRRNDGALAFLYPATAGILAVSGYLCTANGELTRMFTPAFFYEVTAPMPLIHLLSWLSVPLIVAFASICRKHLVGWMLSVISLSAAVLSFISYSGRSEMRYEKEYDKMALLAANEQWKELADFSRRHLTNYQASNYHNLAQAQMGMLAENLFKVPQGGPASLIHISGEHAADICLAHVLYACGNMAGAQNIAFNALQTGCGYNPTLFKMLAKIELMRGSYEVAEKYINILGKSHYYKAWAERYRAFLWNDSMVENDPELGNGRRDLPISEGFVNDRSPMDELLRIIESNPSDRKAMEYALSYLLLAKDFITAYSFIKDFYGTPGLSTLPTPAQEALIFFSDYYNTQTEEYALSHGLTKEQFDEYRQVDLDWCREHGVEEDTIQRFASFKEAYGRNRGGNVPSGYGDTWWHYMLYTKI